MADLSISCEFFPPRDDAGRERLVDNVAKKLEAISPGYFSVTYGAGGSTRDGTTQTIKNLLEAGYSAVPHFSLGGASPGEVKDMLDNYRAMGVDQIVALRGDQPSGMGGNRFANNAEALIKVIRDHSGDHFSLIVAAYPEVHPDATSADQDLDFFQRKVDAGASKAITQYFYNPDAYENFLNACTRRNIQIPIIPGIMPISNYASIHRFSQNCGAEIPRWLDQRLKQHEDDEAATQAISDEALTRLCERLIALGAPGFHFYTLNRWGAAVRVCRNLGL